MYSNICWKCVIMVLTCWHISSYLLISSWVLYSSWILIWLLTLSIILNMSIIISSYPSCPCKYYSNPAISNTIVFSTISTILNYLLVVFFIDSCIKISFNLLINSIVGVCCSDGICVSLSAFGSCNRFWYRGSSLESIYSSSMV